jgi:hypothetical protein
MLFQSSPFETRAAFLYRNVCDFPAELTHDRIESSDKEEILEGLRYLRQLMLDIYADTGAYRTEDDLESYHRLTQTVLFLYMAGAYGELMREGEVSFLRLDKSLIRKHFKKPAAFHLDALANYGFYFEYEKNGHFAESYQLCDSVLIYNESCPSFFPALKYLICRNPAMDSKKDYAMQADLFMRADFETVLLGAGKRKEDIDPLRPDIMRSLGSRAELWKGLVSDLMEGQGLKAGCKFWSYCTPHWIIHLTRKGKPVCIFTIHTDCLFFEMAAPYEQLEALAEDKEQLVPAIRKNMEQFGCIKCGRCGGESITLVNGITLCTREPWARRFTFEIADAMEAKAVSRLIIDIRKEESA